MPILKHTHIELEILHLEKRYTRRNHEAAYKGSAKYEDGEYVHKKSNGKKGNAGEGVKGTRSGNAFKWR